MKNAKEKKGITLIALVITIIVMLILVGVTVSIVIENNLFEITENAVNQTEIKYEEEKNLTQVTINNKIYNSIDGYVNPVETITFTVGGDEYTVPKGWTWEQFIGSSYDTSSGVFFIGNMEGYCIWYGRDYAVVEVMGQSDPIQEMNYTLVDMS